MLANVPTHLKTLSVPLIAIHVQIKFQLSKLFAYERVRCDRLDDQFIN